ncbi:MAG TPA: hypothetical protein PLK32_08190 [Defluviitoga tunisiensis]|nr:hypothetical protein [Defluviitoga tunisiensis]
MTEERNGYCNLLRQVNDKLTCLTIDLQSILYLCTKDDVGKVKRYLRKAHLTQREIRKLIYDINSINDKIKKERLKYNKYEQKSLFSGI